MKYSGVLAFGLVFLFTMVAQAWIMDPHVYLKGKFLEADYVIVKIETRDKQKVTVKKENAEPLEDKIPGESIITVKLTYVEALKLLRNNIRM